MNRQGGLSGQKERSGTGDEATRGELPGAAPTPGGLASVWACAEGAGAGRFLVGVQEIHGRSQAKDGSLPGQCSRGSPRMFGDSAGGSLPALKPSMPWPDQRACQQRLMPPIGGSSLEGTSGSCLLPVSAPLPCLAVCLGLGGPDLLVFFTVSLQPGGMFLTPASSVTCRVTAAPVYS